MGKPIVVVRPDPSWPARYEREAARLRELLGDDLVAIHHVGSTSVPDLWAKPIIDVLPVIVSVERFEARRAACEAAGFTWRGEYGIPGRRYLRTDDLHVHCYEAHHHQVARHLAFRDHLRAHTEARDEYAALKRDLAARFAHDADAYLDGKSELVERVLREAMGDGYERP